eukprot:870779-Prymnesium_polylepis.1
MQRLRADPNAEAWRQAYMAALTQDAGGAQALQEGGGRTNQLLNKEGFPLEVEMVKRSRYAACGMAGFSTPSWMCGRPAGGRAGTPA